MGAADDDNDTEGGAVLKWAIGMCGAIVVRTIEDGSEAGCMGLGRGGVAERWHDSADLDMQEDDGRDGGRGADVTIMGLCALDDVIKLDTGRVARVVEMTLLAGTVEETAGDDVLGAAVAVVIGSRSSRGEMADDETIELLFGAA